MSESVSDSMREGAIVGANIVTEENGKFKFGGLVIL